MFVNNRNMDPKMRDVWFVSVAAARPRAWLVTTGRVK